MEILLITGPPYSGKGTQCHRLKEYLGFEHLSTGERCRTEKKSLTKIGKTLSEYEEKGELVPDNIMKSLVGQMLEENRSNAGVILDGYPRTKAQVDDFLDIANGTRYKVGKVLYIDVPKAELLKRAEERAETSDREDDKNKETHVRRIEIFETLTRPAIKYLKEKTEVMTFNGLGSVEEISDRIISKL